MSLRGTAASTTASVRGTHLMADECCFANSAPCAGPICGANSWPESITCPLTSESKFDLASHVLARSVFVQLEWCADKSAALRRRFRRALGTGTRGREVGTVSLSSRTCSDSNRYAARTVRSKTVRAKRGVSAERRMFHVKLYNSSLLTPHSQISRRLRPSRRCGLGIRLSGPGRGRSRLRAGRLFR